ncbi:MAG TPA: class I SAM-dependent methyltransferase [Candidatus Acidoferrum sp.]|nr:class I SAM-dependent methyltransferase [Candidatus Acidoferrum sp.]
MVSFAFFSLASGAGEVRVRYLRFDEVQETLRLNADSGLPGSEIAESAAWDAWVRTRDAEVRSRIDRGIEDSISNLILYGTSFTSLPRVESVERAASESGELAPATIARIHALALALPSATKNERVHFVRDFLARQEIAKNSEERYFAENLRRFIAEQAAYQKKLQEAAAEADPSAVYLARGTLFETRGLSVDTSLLPNLALEETLRAMARKGVLASGSMRRIAVIGPGLDFTDKRDGYDFYPLQTLQPFAVLEAAARLDLGKAEELQVVCLDLNSAVIAHVQKLSERGRAGQAYNLQLPRDPKADWSPEAISYWEHFGEILGSPTRPLPVPATLRGVVARAVAVRPQFAARMKAYDANIVTQTLDFPAGQGLDLVVATNVLVYYDRFQQALAMANIARMMNRGGIFLANNVLPAQHTSDLEYLGRRTTAFTPSGAYGDDVVVYRRRREALREKLSGFQ